MGVAHMAIATLHVSNVTCITGQVLGHLSYGIVFGVLFSKTWRVHLLVDSGFRDINMTSAYVNSVTFLGLLVQWIMLIVLVLVARPFRSVVATSSGDQTTLVSKCSFHHPLMSTVLLSLEGFSLLFGARMCWVTRGATEVVNAKGLGREGAHLFINKNVMLAIYTMIMICVVEFAGLYVTKLKAFEEVLVVNIGFFIALLSATLSLFVPKLLALYFPSKEEKTRTNNRDFVESRGSTAVQYRQFNSSVHNENRNRVNVSSTHSRGSVSPIAVFIQSSRGRMSL